MRRVAAFGAICTFALGVGAGVRANATTAPEQAAETPLFFTLLKPSPGLAWKTLREIDAGWQPHYPPMLIEVARFSPHRKRILKLLEQRADAEREDGEDAAFENADAIAFEDAEDAFRWVWSRPEARHPGYAAFKSALYTAIDPRFGGYFDDAHETARIRLDEVRWGGVKRDGIVPLVNPPLLRVEQAGYLDDGDVVFAAVVAGEARAYPKRVLGWHELVRDRIGDVDVTGVYCTLCGSMVLYRSPSGEPHPELGTSGFLYRSNKLMVDAATDSLWSTLRGEPVIGPLAGSGVRLEPLPVVTTTWGAWHRAHPETRVLSHRTRQRHDYSEGAAYREYFATDELMFAVPASDPRLANKDEVLALRFGTGPPTALAVEMLRQRPVYAGQHGGVDFVVVTDAAGAHRVYAAPPSPLTNRDGDAWLGADGQRWQAHEHALIGSEGTELTRLPAHRAFWFGWRAAHPDTRLVKAP
ncbi:MAG: DUF3179 domain-containing (seleno)protein [Myxococcota bacterium]